MGVVVSGAVELPCFGVLGTAGSSRGFRAVNLPPWHEAVGEWGRLVLGGRGAPDARKVTSLTRNRPSGQGLGRELAGEAISRNLVMTGIGVRFRVS